MQEYKTESPFDITLSEEQQMTWDMLRKFAETELRPQARKTETNGMPSNELLEKIKSLDLIPLIIPEEYGGMGLKQDSVSNALSLEALAYGDLSLAMSLSIPFTLKLNSELLFLESASIHAVGKPTNPNPITEIFFFLILNLKIFQLF